jgi:hypothetical protein
MSLMVICPGSRISISITALHWNASHPLEGLQELAADMNFRGGDFGEE